MKLVRLLIFCFIITAVSSHIDACTLCDEHMYDIKITRSKPQPLSQDDCCDEEEGDDSDMVSAY